MEQRDIWGWKQQNCVPMRQQRGPAVHGGCHMTHYGWNTGCIEGRDEFEKMSWNQTVKSLECSEEFGLIIRIYELCSLTSYVLVT